MSVHRARGEPKVLPRRQHLAPHVLIKASETSLAAECLMPMVVAHEAEFSSARLALIFHGFHTGDVDGAICAGAAGPARIRSDSRSRSSRTRSPCRRSR